MIGPQSQSYRRSHYGHIAERFAVKVPTPFTLNGLWIVYKAVLYVVRFRTVNPQRALIPQRYYQVTAVEQLGRGRVRFLKIVNQVLSGSLP